AWRQGDESVNRVLRVGVLPKVLSVDATPVLPSTRSASLAPPLRLHLGGGWAIAGLLNILFDLLPGEEARSGGADAVLAHAGGLGRQLGPRLALNRRGAAVQRR